MTKKTSAPAKPTQRPGSMWDERPSQQDFHGFLAHDTAEGIVDRLERLLGGTNFTLVTYNANNVLTGARPVVITDQWLIRNAPETGGVLLTVRELEGAERDEDELVSIVLRLPIGLLAMRSHYATMDEVRDLATTGADPYSTWLDIWAGGSTTSSDRQDQVHIRHRNAEGEWLYWVLAVQSKGRG